MLAQAEAWTSRTSAGSLDLAFGPAGIRGYSELIRNARTIELGGLPLLVSSIPDVIRMKEASGRAKDTMQLPGLRATLEALREREREREEG